jgi:hypothetical protein
MRRYVAELFNWISQRLPGLESISSRGPEMRAEASLNNAARCTKLRPIATQILAEK